MDSNKLINSKALKWTIIVVAELALLVLVFRAGQLVGFSKANFNFRWGENYQHLFGGPQGGWIMPSPNTRPGMGGQAFGLDRDLPGESFAPGHNVVGTVIGVVSSTITVKGVNNTEESILVTPGTTIRRGRDIIGIQDIKPNDQIVGLGSPSTTGQIEIKFIRVFEP